MTRGQRGRRRACRCRGSMSTNDDAVGHLERDARRGRRARAFMNCVQIGSAACAPLRPSGWLSSKPTQTTVSSSGVKPTNHASRRSLVVPVLPAASSVKPARARAGAGAFVEHAAHHVGDEKRRVGPRDRRAAGCVGFFVTSLPPRVICRMCLQRPDRCRRFGKSVYAVAISNGVASKTPSAIDGYGFGAVADAELLPEGGDVVVAGRLRHVDRREVARMRERAPERDRAVVLVLVVLRRPDLVVELERRRLVVRRSSRA